MQTEHRISQIADADVSETFHQQILLLLQTCFPDEERFRFQRFNHEMPAYRFYMKADDELIAHIALHEKKIKIDNEDFLCAGIAEVMVHPDWRGQGIVRKILQEIEDFSQARGVQHSMLFGKQEVYSSSGYHVLPNEIRYFDPVSSNWHQEVLPFAMGKTFTAEKFPDGLIDLGCPLF